MTPQVHMNATSTHQAGRTVVVGLGRTGLSCARYLHGQGIEFAVTDSRVAPPESAALQRLAPATEVVFGKFDEGLLDGAAQIVVSPGVSLREPFLVKAAERGISIAGDIELFARAARAPVAAVTGTNGKSTVTTLVAQMAAACGKRVLAGGNLGRPALELLEDATPELYVLELSSFQLDTTRSLRLEAAAVLNVTPDHLDRYDGIEAYAASKARIFMNCATAVLNLDDPAVRGMAGDAVSGDAPSGAIGSAKVQRVLGFSLAHDPAADYYVAQHGDDVALMYREQRLALLSELKITGLHNAANALAALAMGDALGLSRQRAMQALCEFPGLPHRSQWIADIAGVRYVEDSKGTNVGATLAAVAGMPAPLVLIAGGLGKGQDFAPLATALRGKARHVVLLGQDARLIAAALRDVASIEFARDMDDAVHRAAAVARPGDTVLLSPACASMDMFRDYAHRGEVFAAAVRSLSA